MRVLAAPAKPAVPVPNMTKATSTPIAAPAKRAVARKREPKAVPPADQALEPSYPAVVGLTVESTVNDGTGPAFATGHTLSGATETMARNPVELSPRPATVATPAVRASRNRVARAQHAAGVHVEPARRLSQVEPEYPALLQSQRIEGDVTVRVTLSPQGVVQHVELVRPARDVAFNDAALAAALRERFSAETHDARPVSTSLTYSYRFRISP